MAEEKNILNPEGLFNPSLRFAFSNILEDKFVSAWGGQVIEVPAGETVELPHHLACKLTKELVDKIMIGNAKLDELAYYNKNPNTQPNMYRAPNSLGVPAARKVWEDRICRQLEVNEESPQMQIIRAQIKADLEADMKKEVAGGSPLDNAPSSVQEFADLTQKSEPKELPQVKLKKVKVVK